MKIAFVQNMWYEYLGIMSISGVLKKGGHETKVFINALEKNLLKSLSEYEPDIIGLPVYSGSQGWVFEIAANIKKKLKDSVVVVGGPHATFMPQVIKNKGIDVVCVGEGEYPMLDLANALSSHKSYLKIKNLWVKKNNKIYKNSVRSLIDPLDLLEYLDRELYYRYPRLAGISIKYFSIGRGCPFNCAYCHNHVLKNVYLGKGRYVRHYSRRRAIEEILRVKNKYPLKVVEFVDDTFILNKSWLLKFLKMYKEEISLPFVCNVRGGLLDEELASGLAKAGCTNVFIGIETGNEKMRTQLLNKVVTNKEIIKAVKLLHKYGINLSANNMIGLPDETLDMAIETVRLNALVKIDFPWCAIFQPYPGTEMADYCLKKGYIKKKDLESIGVTFHKKSVISSPDIDELVRLHKLFHIGVWFPSSIPLLKLLVKLPLDPLYQFIFLVNQGLTYMHNLGLGFVDFIPQAINFSRMYLTTISRKPERYG